MKSDRRFLNVHDKPELDQTFPIPLILFSVPQFNFLRLDELLSFP